MSFCRTNRLLYFSSTSYGGLADYAHEQARALVNRGVEVVLLAPPGSSQRLSANYGVNTSLQDLESAGAGSSGLARMVRKARCLLRNQALLAHFVARQNHTSVLLGSYAEYLAPLWAWRLRRLSRKGVVFGAMVHDPVRDFQLGPTWWHRRSVAEGYSFLSEAFVHEDIRLDTGSPVPDLTTTVVPHGPYVFPAATSSRIAVRKQLDLPEDGLVLLAFGHIRDNKNLDLTLRALAKLPGYYLLVVGNQIGGSQRPLEFYRELAGNLGVKDRVRWRNGFVPTGEVANYFAAADGVLLNYGASFRSASGVVNVAVAQRRSCVASAGGGNLRTVVQRYQLGVWVPPDDLDALIAGLRRWREDPPRPRWEEYLREHSWERNAELVWSRFLTHQSSRAGSDKTETASVVLPAVPTANGKATGTVMVYAPTQAGGLAEHVYYQACELERRGWDVKMLIAPGFLDGRKLPGKPDCLLLPAPQRGRSRWMTRLRQVRHILENQRRLAWRVWRERPTFVLADSYSEYLSPLWFWAPWLVSRLAQVPIVANLHDPVRDFCVGPAWWHRLSIACAYRPLSLGLVHQTVPAAALVPERLPIVEVPMGVFRGVAPPVTDPATLRDDWKVPAGTRAFLAFGYLRDNKNIDLVLRAMADVPEAFLVVVGQASSSHSRPIRFYHDLACQLGITDRVRFYDQFVTDREVTAYFAAADFIVLTYAATFVSQSGVLNVAARVAKPVLASSGPGALRQSVETFGLGEFVEPDSVPAIAEGMRRLIVGSATVPQWEKYFAYASWQTNVDTMLAALSRWR